MANTITARPNQSMQDIVLMACGTLEGAMEFCRANEVSISDLPVVGRAYVIPSFDKLTMTDNGVLTEIAYKGIVIGTLGMELCAVVTGLTELLLTDISAKIGYVAGAGAVSVEYAVTGTGETPSEWTVAASSPITLTELTAGTEYRVWFRTNCYGNNSAPVYIDITTDAPVVPLAATVVLYPKMKVQPETVGPVHNIKLQREGIQFVHVYDLLADFLADNVMQFETMSAYISDLGAGATPLTALETSMTDEEATFSTGIGLSIGQKYMFWSDPEAGVLTITFEDVNNNIAATCPVVVMSDTWSIVQYLAPEIAVEVLTATSSEVVVRLTSSHDELVVANMNLDSMSWEDPAGMYTLEEDPDNPGNPDIRLATLTAGTYKVGVNAVYVSDDTMTTWPGSRSELVIEVA